MPRPEQRVAIYDMDRTVTARATFTPFLLLMARWRAPWRLLLAPALLLTLLAYALRLLDRARLKTVNHRLMIGARTDEAALAPHLDRFARRTVAGNTLADARARIARDRADGYRLVLATASYDLYAGRIAALLGFDEVIGTRLARDGGAVLARLDGPNCYGEAKMDRVRAWFAQAGIDRAAARVRAYSDHATDAPLLAFADEPVAVNAHGPLRALAAARGWRLEEWR